MSSWTCQAPGCGVRVVHESSAVKVGCGVPPGWRLVGAADLPVCGVACDRALRAALEDPHASSDARRRPVGLG